MANTILELFPIKPSLTFHMKYSLMTLGLFRSSGLKRNYHAKSVCVHILRDHCHVALDNLANEDSPPDNEDIVLASMKSRGEQVITKDAAPNSNAFAAAALGGRPSIHSSERPQELQVSLVEFWKFLSLVFFGVFVFGVLEVFVFDVFVRVQVSLVELCKCLW